MVKIEGPNGTYPGMQHHSSDANPELSQYGKSLPSFPVTYRHNSDIGSMLEAASKGDDIDDCDDDDDDDDACTESMMGDDYNSCASLLKKRKKQMVSEDSKDDKYWERRRKNNLAAKRSRDARRAKENQVAIRATFLERENKLLAQELRKARAENHLLKERLCKYELIQ